MGRTIRLPEVRPGMLLLLAVAGFILLVASSASYSIQWVPVVPFGLFGLLPLGYWIGIGLISMSIVLGIRSGNEKLFFAQIMMLYLGIWGAPVFFERYASVWDSYIHFYSSQQIVETGTTISEGLGSYSANYPGFYTVGATFSLLSGAEMNDLVLSFLRFYPLFASAFTLLAMYLFVRTYLPSKDYRFAMAISVLSNVWVQYQFSPQSMGLACGLLIFVFLEKDGFRWLLLAFAAFTFLVVSHPTTTLFVMLAIIIREVFVVFRRWRSHGMKYEKPWPALVFVLVWVSWLLTGAQEYSRFLFTQIYNKLQYIFLIPEETSKAAAQRTVGNIFPLGSQLRILVLGVFMLLLMISLLVYLWNRRKASSLPMGVVALTVVPILVVPLDIFILQGQVYDRGFLFFTLAAPILFTMIYFRRWTTMRKLLAVAVILFVVAGAASTFYQESLYVVSDRSLEMTEYLVGDMPRQNVVVGGRYAPLVWANGDFGKITEARYYVPYNMSFSDYNAEVGHAAMIFDRSAELWQEQYGQLYIYNFYLDNITANNKVYDNGAYMMIYGGSVHQ